MGYKYTMKKALVIGGGIYQCTLIKRLVQLGYKAYCVDKNPNAPGFGYSTGYRNIDACDAEACLAYASEIGIDGVMTYGATITLPTVSYIGKKLNLPSLPIETAKIAKNKYAIKKRLADAGCNIKGDFFEMYTLEDAQKYKFNIPCVIKPSDGSGSKGVSIVHKEDQLKQAIEYAFSVARCGKIYYESYIPGDEYTVEAFVCNGEVYIYGTIKTTFERKEGNNISYGHRIPSGLPDEVETAINDEVVKAIRALNITITSVNFDLIIAEDDRKPYIIDCGIRVGQNLIASHLIPLSRGISILDNTIHLLLGEEIKPEPKYRKCVASRLLIYEPGIIKEIKPVDDVIGKNEVIDVILRKNVGEIQKPFQDKSDSCGWVICGGNTPDEAESNAEIAKEILRNYIIIEPIK